MIISHNLLREIDKKQDKVKNSPDYYLKRSHQLRVDLKGICDIHSFFIENPKLRGRILNENHISDPRKLRRIARNGVKRIERAWKFLSSPKFEDDYKKYFTPRNLAEVSTHIDPDVNKGCYRPEGITRLNLGGYVVPPSHKIPDLVEKLCLDIVESDYHPLERAANIHLRIAGIQPFVDGNKRLARLFEDKVLWDSGLPPVFIPAGEREVYLDLLEQALLHLEDHNLQYQRPFFDYIGGKVNSALDEVIGDLKIN